jgi:putative transposase
MPNFRRFYVVDSIVFITCVTFERNHHLEYRQDLDIFWQTLRNAQKIHPFHLLAYVVLPDHFHWHLQVKDSRVTFSDVMHCFKRNFTKNFKKAHDIRGNVHLWQERFWDHIIRNELDLERHFDYIHWNPVKHQYVFTPGEWPESSLHYWIRKGYYPASWMDYNEPANNQERNFGE